MRWGIRADASDDHSTVDLCLRELDACKKLSFGTFFVVSENLHYYIRLILFIYSCMIFFLDISIA